MQVISWNVAGVPLGEIGTFFQHATDVHPWDFLCLQEAFRQTSGIATCSCSSTCDCARPIIFTPEVLHGGLRCPAVIVNEAWGSVCRAAGSSARWVAIDVKQKVLVASAHLPLSNRPLSEFMEVLEELSSLLRKYKNRKVLVALDANCRMSGMQDWQVVGPAVPSVNQVAAAEAERASVFHEFLSKHALYLANTWTSEEDPQEVFTRSDWDGVSCLAQIDFLAASNSLKLQDCRVHQGAAVNSDHFALAATVVTRRAARRPDGPRPARTGWRPATSFHAAVEEQTPSLDWQDWPACTERLASLAAAHEKPREQNAQKEQEDEVLRDLLVTASSLAPVDRRLFGKQIWRRRRFLRRQRARTRLERACEAGKAPRVPSGSTHVNWLALSQGRDPREILFEHFFEIYGLESEEKECATAARTEWIERWRSEQAHDLAEPFVVTPELLGKALKRLKPGKASPDGLTAEVLRELPEQARTSFAAELTRRFASLEIPTDWTQVVASLIPKTAGAKVLTKFRPIASLTAVRKLWGYIWLMALPVISFLSLQTAFVPGVCATHGVYTLKRAAELAREWICPWWLCRLI